MRLVLAPIASACGRSRRAIMRSGGLATTAQERRSLPVRGGCRGTASCPRRGRAAGRRCRRGRRRSGLPCRHQARSTRQNRRGAATTVPLLGAGTVRKAVHGCARRHPLANQQCSACLHHRSTHTTVPRSTPWPHGDKGREPLVVAAWIHKYTDPRPGQESTHLARGGTGSRPCDDSDEVSMRINTSRESRSANNLAGTLLAARAYVACARQRDGMRSSAFHPPSPADYTGWCQRCRRHILS